MLCFLRVMNASDGDNFNTYMDGFTHWGRDKMDAIFQTTFSNEISWMKMYEF